MALLGGALYASYRIGKSSRDEVNEGKNSEEEDVLRYINEIEKKPNKTKVDMDMLDLLREKLNRLKSGL